jgi:hypothetical protein
MRARALFPLLAAGVLVANPRLGGADAAVARPGLTTTIVAGREALVLGFDVLASFPYDLPETGTSSVPARIPEAIHRLNGRRSVITGFMVPLQLEEGRARRFVLVRNQSSCCYGVAPALNEYVLVTMDGVGTRPVMDTPVRVTGKLRVGETYEEGMLVGLYQFQGESVDTTTP